MSTTLASVLLRLALALDPPLDHDRDLDLDPASPPDADYQSAEASPTLDGRYSFCRTSRDTSSLDAHERPWCDRVDSTRCPGLAQACARAAEEEALNPEPDEEAAKELASQDELPRQDELYDEPAPLEVPPGFARLLLWTIGIVAALMIARAVWLGRRREREEPSVAAPTEVIKPVVAKPKIEAPADATAQHLLELAAGLIAAGDYAGATALCHRALVRGLSERGATVLDPARTNGEHLRAAAAINPSARMPLRVAFREVERVHFGHQAPTESTARQLLEGIRAVLSSWAARGIALVAGLLSLSLACAVPEGTGSNLAGLGTDADGIRVLGELLTRRGVKVAHRGASLEELSNSTKALLLTGRRELDDAEWDAVLEWTQSGGHLYVALESSLDPRIPIQTMWVGEHTLAPLYLPAAGEQLDRPQGYAPVVRRVADAPTSMPIAVLVVAGEALVDGRVARRSSPYQTDQERALEFFLGEDQAAPTKGLRNVVARATYGTGSVVVFANEDLVTNVAFAVDGNAGLVTDLFIAESSLEITTAHTGTGAANPLEAVSNAHLLPAILQLGVLFLLVFLWRGTPLVPLRDPTVVSRLAFADHVRALAEQYARAQAPSAALVHYSAWATDRMRERVRHRLRGRAWSELAARIAEATGRDENDVLNILLESDLPEDATAHEELEPTFGAVRERSLADAGASMSRVATLLRQVQGASKR